MKHLSISQIYQTRIWQAKLMQKKGYTTYGVKHQRDLASHHKFIKLINISLDTSFLWFAIFSAIQFLS